MKNTRSVPANEGTPVRRGQKALASVRQTEAAGGIIYYVFQNFTVCSCKNAVLYLAAFTNPLGLYSVQ